jgi:DNA-binding XRE family transcriptional regulator
MSMNESRCQSDRLTEALPEPRATLVPFRCHLRLSFTIDKSRIADTVRQMPYVDDTVLTVARALRDRRRQLKLTQQDVADLAGLARYTVVRVEGGDDGVQFDTVRRIADAVGLTISLSTQYRES